MSHIKDSERLREEFHRGDCTEVFRYLGCHRAKKGKSEGFCFRVWAPRAKNVFLIGDFNGWSEEKGGMQRGEDGIWEAFSPQAEIFDRYLFRIEGADGKKKDKSDPFAFHSATRPDICSKVYDPSGFGWRDDKWREGRMNENILSRPVNIYEVHLGSWRKNPDGNFCSYRDLAHTLPAYAKKMGFTHIEILPLAEYPFDPSWGYQVTGYFAPTSRFGEPKDFMALVDACHRAGIGVILDWVGAHFPTDSSGLALFDSLPLFEPEDEKMRFHPEWQTLIFDYARPEVKSFLISNIIYWLRFFHLDGIRVDAVASMLYLDYGRKAGEWTPNVNGGKENLAAIALLQGMNRAAYLENPAVMMIAEESTAFSLVTKPDFDGGLGFTFKWNMGWMHDSLEYLATDPLFRKEKQNLLTFSMTYAFSENFILPLSHDEVVHSKGSLIGRAPGAYEDKFAELRIFYAYMFAHPGKKLNFMGNEFAQFIEWDFQKELDWHLLGYETHARFQEYFAALGEFYRRHSPLWEKESDWTGFRWIACDDREKSIVSFVRENEAGDEIICIFNFCPVERRDYRIGAPKSGVWRQVFSSCAEKFGGCGGGADKVRTEKIPMHGLAQSVSLELPPLGALFYLHKSRRSKTHD